jgi:PAS domain S-box-containing protein
MEPDRNPKILVVEDEPDIADVLKQLLELKSSAVVDIAGNLQTAREKISSSSYDLITLDYQLPDGFSFELLAEVTSSEAHPPVIVVTGRGNEDVASMAIQQGAAGYIVKNEKLLSTLPEAVEKALKDFVLAQAVEAIRESEAFYHTLFEESSTALFIETIDGIIEDVNQVAVDLSGYSAEELQGMPAIELVPAHLWKDFEDSVVDLLEGKTVEFENVTKSGKVIPVEITAKQVMTRKGSRYIVSVRDISEARKAQKAVENGRSFTLDALNAISDVFTIADENGVIYQWNQALTDITGYTDEEISTMHKVDFFSPEDYRNLSEAVQAVARTGETKRIEVSLLTKDGRAIPYEFNGSLIKDSEGNVLGIAGTGRDVSDRKRAEEALHNVIRETNERREEITALLQSARLVLEHREFQEAAREVFYLCWQLVGAEAGFIALLGEEGAESRTILIEPEALRESMEVVATMPVQSLVTPAFMAGRSVYENDFSQDKYAHEMPEGHFKVENILYAPLLIESKAVGMIGFANKPGGFTGRDSLMASAFGEVASIALRNSQTMEMLRNSEERFRSVAEGALEAVVCADNDLNIVFWNPGAEILFGRSSEEMIGKPITSILPEHLREGRLQLMLQEAAREATPSRIFEMTGLRKDGTEFPMELSRSAWKTGTETNYAVIIRDVEERRRAEDGLREKEELYRTVLYASPDAVTLFDLEGKIVECSRHAAEMYGFDDPDELRGQRALQFVSPTDAVQAAEGFEIALEEGAIRNLEVNLLRKDGSAFIGEISGAVLHDRDGNPTGLITMVRDVTERKESELELQVLNKELEGYAHVVSHDLKGPLSSMMAAGMALRGLVKAGWSDQTMHEVMELVNIIESNVNKSSFLIDELLALAEAGQIPWEVSRVDIEELAKRIVGEHADTITKRGIVVKLDAGLGGVIANPTHMYQLFGNLIDNAVIYNDSPEAEIYVARLGQDSEGRHRFLVRDNGPGIDDSIIDKIFLPFFTGDKGQTGIGLATVNKIVGVYDGTIKAYNDNGACFEFTLMDYHEEPSS